MIDFTEKVRINKEADKTWKPFYLKDMIHLICIVRSVKLLIWK